MILAALGVPLWLCAAGVLVLVFNNRRLRKRPGDVPVRVLRAGKKRWRRGHAIWVSNVLAWRTSPGSWGEELLEVSDAVARAATLEEHKKLHRLASEPTIVSLTLPGGGRIDVATAPEHRGGLLGPFAQPVDVTRNG